MSRLRQIRESRGIRREALAAAAGISHSYVLLLESGKRQAPGVVIAQKIARTLGVEVADLWPIETPDESAPADVRSPA